MTVPIELPVYTINTMEDFVKICKNIYKLQEFIKVLDLMTILNQVIAINYGYRNPEMLMSTENIYEEAVKLFSDVPLIVDLMEDVKKTFGFYMRADLVQYVGLIDRRITLWYDRIFDIVIDNPFLFKYSFEYTRGLEVLYTIGRLVTNNIVIGAEINIFGYDYIINSGNNRQIRRQKQILISNNHMTVKLPVIIKVAESEKTEIVLNDDPYDIKEYRLTTEFNKVPKITMTVIDTNKVMPTISLENDTLGNFVVKDYLIFEKTSVNDLVYISRCLRPGIIVVLEERKNIEEIYFKSVFLIK